MTTNALCAFRLKTIMNAIITDTIECVCDRQKQSVYACCYHSVLNFTPIQHLGEDLTSHVMLTTNEKDRRPIGPIRLLWCCNLLTQTQPLWHWQMSIYFPNVWIKGQIRFSFWKQISGSQIFGFRVENCPGCGQLKFRDLYTLTSSLGRRCCSLFRSLCLYVCRLSVCGVVYCGQGLVFIKVE